MRNRMITVTAFIALASLAMGVQATDLRTGMRPAAQPAMPVAAPAMADLVVDSIQVNPQAREGQPVQGVSVVVKNQGRAAGSAGAVRLSCRAAAGVACPASLTSIMLPLAPLAPNAAATLIVPPNGRDVWPAGKLTLAAEIVGTSVSKSVDVSVAKQLALERESQRPQPEPSKPASPIATPGTGTKPTPPPAASPTPQGKATGSPLAPAKARATPTPGLREALLAAMKARPVAYDPQVKLREFKEAERSRKAGQIQSIKAAMLQKMPTMTAAPSCVQPDPVIKSVSPQEVYPGFPIYIAGCHFGTGQGMVTIPQLNVQVEVTSWSDHLIQGTIPDSITGFSDPKTIGFKVVTVQAVVLQAPATVVLKPNMDVVMLFPADIPQADSGNCCAGLSWYVGLPWTYHGSGAGPECHGVDTIFQGAQLQNSWTFLYLDLNTVCQAVDNAGSQDVDCYPWYATPAQNLSNWVGKPSLPTIQINWSVAAPDKDHAGLLMYHGAAYISGPAGTSYQ